jgi:integrase
LGAALGANTLRVIAGARSEGSQRGRSEERGSSLRVVVYAGVDAVTSKRVYLRENAKDTEKAAYKRADNLRIR